MKRALAIMALLSLGILMTAGCGKKDPTTDAAPPTSGGTANQDTAGGAPKGDPGANSPSGGSLQKPAVNPGG